MVHRRSGYLLAVVVALSVGPASAVAVAASPAGPEIDVVTNEERHALAFRRTFGFDSDLALVRQAAAPGGYSNRAYGVPLSTAEAEEMARRFEVEQASHPAVDYGMKMATWGGYYIDQLAGGAPVFLFTGDEEEMREELGRRLPSGTGYRVVRVDRSLAELEHTMAAITEAQPDLKRAGIHVTSTAVDTAGNDLVVGVLGLTEEARLRLTSQFGDYLRVQEMGPAYSDACPIYNCRQIKGGIRIVGEAGFTWRCTAGWIVRRGIDDSLAVLTAGHCLWAQTNPALNDNWYHGNASNNADFFGDSRYYSYADNVYGDVGLVEIRAEEDDVYENAPNKMWDDDGGTHSVTGAVANVYQTQGSQVCAFGAASNDSRCTSIVLGDANRESIADAAWAGTSSHTILHTKVYGVDLIHGDSGGPLWQRPNPYSNNVIVMGTHVHSEIEGNTQVEPDSTGWYTPYFWGKSAYGLAAQAQGGVNDFYNVCIDATC